jgi:hypothetical protein
MTDELTPKELEALKNLPRERTPSAQLEDRVVASMREHGVLAKKPRRAVAITFPRVATLVAACAALVIGAYSVGLHRGERPELLPSFSPALTDRMETIGLQSVTAPPPTASNEARERQVDETDHTAPSTTLEKKQADAPGIAPPIAAESAVATPKPSAREDESAIADEPSPSPKRANEKRSLARQNEGVEESAQQPSPQYSADASDRVKLESLSLVPSSRVSGTSAADPKNAPVEPLSIPFTNQVFLLDGMPVFVEAPDSVRITQDEAGRVLLIHTSDGIIRIRLQN